MTSGILEEPERSEVSYFQGLPLLRRPFVVIIQDLSSSSGVGGCFQKVVRRLEDHNSLHFLQLDIKYKIEPD
jgi:hypothetical protein